MAEEKEIKISSKELPDDLDELSDDDLDSIAAGILSNQQLSKQFVKAALTKFGSGVASGDCDCWGFTARMARDKGKLYSR